MRSRIPYSRQTIDDADIAAVADCLRSDFLTQGPQTRAFEEAAAAYVGCAHAIAVSNGTAALHLVCQGLGLGPGGLLWTSPNSFVASANAGRYMGADVDFVDIDPQTGSIDPVALEAKLSKARAANRKPDILIAVHFAGHSFGFDRVAALCAEYGVALVEDAAHAFGAAYEDDPMRKVGSHPQSVATTFSFHPLKSITTGEGGMIVTWSDSLARDLAMLRSHGITKDSAMMTHMREEDGDWYYEQHLLGFNYRICDIQAALGVSQMKRIDAFMAARRLRARRYAEQLSGLPLHLPLATDRSSWHLYVVRLDPGQASITRRALFDRLRGERIEAHVHYIPIHTQPYYRKLGFAPGDFPQSEHYYENCLSLPIYPLMTDDDQDRVVACLRDALLYA
ncbi:MAG: UDP-4-amino-4,6-dideoxy-N-acetyl-beta-L-altrosamine transaminase [Sphingomonadales bacterium]|nr:UDP-4-amino-4,6-dideoxy-N-acetyl-beta-L-altrosamine transaminase [Sphingomonadales bacterium]MBK9004856.1 UDP-4-amino-4,6-dideoxy-N-acetyl-beta-L-altrosamine transaminase [Sphingomonadales bacterium]MBK9267415.1 UDP-4-amino-4,6-dideoxy-N-acetyl-beta-L-altrosamine transaminase [Sphingomonadales bacterium]MBP6433177.1 UDP-4-amino-4,6-dideoxy-N-acetyl-beta-L-altrosamine transaminase [Sphingorhabdus sp.]